MKHQHFGAQVKSPTSWNHRTFTGSMKTTRQWLNHMVLAQVDQLTKKKENYKDGSQYLGLQLKVT